MMTPREKIRIVLLFTGIVLLVTGAAVACAKDNKEQNSNAPSNT